MENVEVCVSREVFQHLNSEILLIVCERAKRAVFTLIVWWKEGLAELCFVFVRVVELFDSVMSKLTLVLVGALFLVHEELTPLSLVSAQSSSPVLLLVVVEGTLLGVVLPSIVAVTVAR